MEVRYITAETSGGPPPTETITASPHFEVESLIVPTRKKTKTKKERKGPVKPGHRQKWLGLDGLDLKIPKGNSGHDSLEEFPAKFDDFDGSPDPLWWHS